MGQMMCPNTIHTNLVLSLENIMHRKVVFLENDQKHVKTDIRLTDHWN